MAYAELEQHLRPVRQAAGLSQLQLVRQAQIARRELARIEAGVKGCGPERLRRLAAVLEADYAELARLAGHQG